MYHLIVSHRCWCGIRDTRWTHFIKLIDEARCHPRVFFLIEIGMLWITIWTSLFSNHCADNKVKPKSWMKETASNNMAWIFSISQQLKMPSTFRLLLNAIIHNICVYRNSNKCDTRFEPTLKYHEEDKTTEFIVFLRIWWDFTKRIEKGKFDWYTKF